MPVSAEKLKVAICEDREENGPRRVKDVGADVHGSMGVIRIVVALHGVASLACGDGGREFQAQAGATDASKIQLGFDTFESMVRAKLA